jgi:hypothetical protein
MKSTILWYLAIIAALFVNSDAAFANQGRRVELMMPPEYVACSAVPQQLAEVDARLRQYRRNSTSPEVQFWLNRQERLIARAYTCQGD